MGGGSELEWVDVEDLEALAANIFQVCDTVAYGISVDNARAALEGEYSQLDQLLASLGDSLPLVVSKTAAHITTVQRLRHLAARYKDLEVTTLPYVEAARRLAEGLLQALGLAVQRMKHTGELLMAVSAAHRAVGRDMDLIVSDAADIIQDPLKSDIGLKAAPVLGATAAGSLGLILLRGALGPVAAIALGTLGALGAKEITETNVVPHVRAAFERMYDEAAQVSSLIDSKASALAVIAGDLMGAALLIQQLMDLSLHHGAVSKPSLAPTWEQVQSSLSTLLLRSEGCRQRLTAFSALTYTLAPKGQGTGGNFGARKGGGRESGGKHE